MKTHIHKSCSVMIAFLLVTGCAAMFIEGGSLVSAGYEPQKILVTYRAEGIVPPGVTYLLVESDRGPAIFERSEDGSGTLLRTHWRDQQGDHFAGWVVTSHGYEYIVPLDRSKPAKKFVYPKGYYSVKGIDGVSRPVPATQMDPVAKLIPE